MRKRLWGIAIVGLVYWQWPSAMTKPLDLDAGTLSDNFGMFDRVSGHFTEVNQLGKPVRELDVRTLLDARVVGTRRSAGLVWSENKRIAFAPIDHLDKKQLFGKRVDKVCAQTATTHLNFGVAWLERDGAIWVLRGDSYAQLTPSGTLDTAAVASPYCGIASAELGVALLYQSDNRFELMRCPEDKKCGSPRKVSISNRETLLGFGCTRHACLVASRDRGGTTTLHWLDDKAKTIAKRTIEATKDAAVQVVGEGERFAIAYSTGPDPVVEIADAPGQLRQIYAGGDSNTTPTITWMGNVLLIAAQRDGELRWETQVL